MRTFGYAATILFLVPAVPAQAQMPAELIKCAAIARDSERLACYDAAIADSSAEARAASQLRVRETARITAEEAAAAAAAAKIKAAADAVALAAAKREAFGAEGVGARGADRFVANPAEIQQIEAAVTETLVNRSSQNVFLLDNGQMWRQVDTGSLPNVRTGDRVIVARAALGGYHLTLVKQNRTVLVKRLH